MLDDEKRALVERYLPFARWAVRRLVNRRSALRLVPDEDLLSAAYLGLCQAATKFEPQRGLQFGTFAYYKIRACINDTFCLSHVVTPPRSEHGISNPASLSAAKKAHEPTLRFARENRQRTARKGSDVPEPIAPDMPYDDGMGFELALLILPESQRHVVRLRFEQDLTNVEIAARLGVTRQRISQILRSAFARLEATWGAIDRN